MGQTFFVGLQWTLQNCARQSVPRLLLKLLGSLSEEFAIELMKPCRSARSFWRVPRDTAAAPTRHQRGLAQGLASSVLLSEFFVSIFLRRLQRCVNIGSVCYVDDVSVVATNRSALESALDLLGKFALDFKLVSSGGKTELWGQEGMNYRRWQRRWPESGI